MILILGDSNYRDTMDKYGETLSAEVKERINFVMITSNESTKSTLEKLNPKDNYKIIIVAAPVNEIAHKVKTGGKKGRDETIKGVVEEQNKLINASATTDGRLGMIHLLIPPFLRQDPAWMEEKIRLITFYMKDFMSVKSPWNVGIGNPVEIVPDDLVTDRVHLNEGGMVKLYKGLAKDILKCKDNLGEGSMDDGTIQFSQDWASQIVDDPAPRTPGTLRKRTRGQDQDTTDDEDEDEVAKKKQKKSPTEEKMDMMLQMMKEMKEGNESARSEVTVLKDKVGTTDKKVDDLKAEVDGATELTAEMREDIDGLQNENLRAVVIVRKLKAEKSVPKDKKALRTYIQDLARALTVKVMGSQEARKAVKYAAMLYAFVDPTKKDNKEGLVPPFKICFHCKDVAVEFRDRAVALAKVGQTRRTFGADAGDQMEDDVDEEEARPANAEKNCCQGAYFTFYQTAATRIRATLMWAVADALKTKTKQVWVSQGNKPTLQVKEGGKVVKSLTFVQTMNEYKEKISQKTLDEAKKAAAKLFAGRLERTFLVIKD